MTSIMSVRGGGVRWLVTCIVLCWSAMVAQGTAQTCTQVADSSIMCEQAGTIQVALSCPDKYIIKVLTLSYQVAATPGCPAPYTGDPPADHCLVSNDPTQAHSQCNFKGVCAYEVVKDTSGTCGGNRAHYIRIVHYCEPLQNLGLSTAGVTSMTSTAPLSGVQLAYISSNPLTSGDVTFTDTTMGCIVTVPDNTQITFQILQLLKSPTQSGCNQKIQFWDGISYASTICGASTTEMTLGGCDISGNTFYIKYLNADPSVKVNFIISARVSHHGAGFDMLCGLQVAFLPAVLTTTTITPPTTTHTHTDPNPELKVATAPPQDEMSLKLIIILVSVAVSLIIVIIIIGVIIKKFSRKSTILESSELEDLTTNTPAFNNVRKIYLHGQSSSQLVMDRKRSSTASAGSMALRV